MIPKDNKSITIITLSKNDKLGFLRTSRSILKQKINIHLEWLILDGSNNKIFKQNANYLKKINHHENLSYPFINLKHVNMQQKKINGIYPCMNFGLSIAQGDSIIFLNGGDTFFDRDSLKNLNEFHQKYGYKKVLTFGQAKIISKIGISWNFPGASLGNINRWLSLFEPNHQAMLVSSDIAKTTLFNEESQISGDKFWKRSVLSRVDKLEYLRIPVCNFYLEGFSSQRPDFKIVISQMKDRHISKLRKLIILLKFLIPKSFYRYFSYLQKFKCKIIDMIL